MNQRKSVAKANTRLQLPVPEFSLVKRRVVIQGLLQDPELLSHIDRVSTEEGVARKQVMERARCYAQDIGPAFSTFFYFRLGYWLSRTLLRLHFRVRTVSVAESELASISPGSTVILVSNHRSNMDPLVITYQSSRRSTVALSAGEWARLWPLHHLIRASGGFVVDRDAADPLYARVLSVYVRLAAASGVHQAFFPEGELTRDGRVGQPKLGFLNYYCRALSEDRDIVFIPVGINYERTPEDHRLADTQLRFETRSKWFLLKSSLRYLGSVLILPLRKREHRFGYACIAFGAPLSLKAWLQQKNIDANQTLSKQRYPWLPQLAEELMNLCSAQIPAPPVVIIAAILCGEQEQKQKRWKLNELMNHAKRLIQLLTERGANVYVPGEADKTLAFALKMLLNNQLILYQDDGSYAVNPTNLPVLQRYANSIAHLVA